MADTKISALTELSSLDTDDEFAVVDTSATETKKVTSQTVIDLMPDATTSASGFMSSTDKTKLDGVETSADVTDATNVDAAGAVMEADFDANTVLIATTDDSPTSLILNASRILGRRSTGSITALTPAHTRELIETPVFISVACSDETSDIQTQDAIVTFRTPFAITLTDVRASVTTAPVGASLVLDINEGGTSILSTSLSIDAGEKTSTTAATAAVISDTTLADDAEITIDITQVGATTSGRGLKVTLIGTETI